MPTKTPRFSAAPVATVKRINFKVGYGSKWRKLRDKRITEESLCRHCDKIGILTPAVEVDHIVPKALGGQDNWSNTQSLCKGCHQAKTRNDMRTIRSNNQLNR
ncbi:HNH endonuclease signature motif containing protein [Sphingomonas sp. Leaf257]|uniref:HNH endonuclease n=1 Tax=Sphingomonas sp. Leaf257 TaxID=1736309 RepID=UPI0009EA8EE3